MAIDFACKTFELDDIIKCGLGLTRSEFKVMKFLIQEHLEINSHEIANKLKLDLSTAQRALKKLVEHNVIIRGQRNLVGGGYVYVYKSSPKTQIRKIILKIIKNWNKKVENKLERW
ncbi:MarR family transcriptional regulator [Candidatus Pacearchaeota archaeon]|nr:MarR family transcriptional regulator [Candidatus Pacearchaeota archaeon]